MSSLLIAFVVVLALSSVACWRLAKKRGYDIEMFTLGGFIGGPFAVHAALNAHKYAVELEDEEVQSLPVPEEQAALAEPESPMEEAPQPEVLPEPELPQDGLTPLAEPALPDNQSTVLPEPALPADAAPFMAPPALPGQAPPLPEKGSGAPVPSIPEKIEGAPLVPPPLAGHAPPIPKPLVPGLPQNPVEPPLPKEIPAPAVHEEQEDDQHKDESVPAVNKTEPEMPEVAPRPRSLIELITAEPTTQRRLGPEAFLEEEEDERPKKGKTQPANVVLGDPDENGVPTLAVAPGEVTLGMCPHCGEDSYADWYGLCIECIQPFPVRVAYVDPTIKPDLAEGEEEAPASPSKKGKITLPKLKK